MLVQEGECIRVWLGQVPYVEVDNEADYEEDKDGNVVYRPASTLVQSG